MPAIVWREASARNLSGIRGHRSEATRFVAFGRNAAHSLPANASDVRRGGCGETAAIDWFAISEGNERHSASTWIGCSALDPGQAVHLAAAGKARRDQPGRRVGLGRRDQDAVGQGLAHLVMAVLVAERPGHAATARVELLDLEARHPAQGGERARRARAPPSAGNGRARARGRAGARAAARALERGRPRTRRPDSRPPRPRRRRAPGGSRDTRRRASPGSSARSRRSGFPPRANGASF